MPGTTSQPEAPSDDTDDADETARVHRADPENLRRLRTALEDVYGDRIERLVLFGSRARGDARADSDYDVALFLHGYQPSDFWAETGRLAEVTTRLLHEVWVVINVKPFPAGWYAARVPLMLELRYDGVDF